MGNRVPPISPEKSGGVFYKKPIKINEMVGPEGLERQRPTVFDLPIMRSSERVEPGE